MPDRFRVFHQRSSRRGVLRGRRRLLRRVDAIFHRGLRVLRNQRRRGSQRRVEGVVGGLLPGSARRRECIGLQALDNASNCASVDLYRLRILVHEAYLEVHVGPAVRGKREARVREDGKDNK